jgi:hypothetical protein
MNALARTRARRLCAAAPMRADTVPDALPVLLELLAHHSHHTDAHLIGVATARVGSCQLTPGHARTLLEARRFVRGLA